MTNEQIVKATEELFGKIAGPTKQLNTLLVDHIEKLTQFQLKAAETYAGLGIDQLKASLSVQDPKSLQDFVKGQSKVAENVTKKFSSDAETLAKLNQDFAVSVQKLVQESGAGFAATLKKSA